MPIPSLKRRSHLTRTPLAKTVKITDRDISDIFEPLSRHAQLTTRQLVAIGSRYPTITKARLGELWHMTGGRRTHYLHRLNETIPLANHLFVEDLHRLGEEGEDLLVARGIVPNEPWVAASRVGVSSSASSRIARLAHDHMASDIALDIEIGVRRAGLAYRSHIDILRVASPAARSARRPLQIPVLLNGERTSIEPDALFGIGNRYFALEADKGTESVRAVVVSKILAYREAVASCMIDEWLGIENLTVLFATPSMVRKRNMMTELETIARQGRSPMFGFASDPAFAAFTNAAAPSGRYATMPWARVGFDNLQLID